MADLDIIKESIDLVYLRMLHTQSSERDLVGSKDRYSSLIKLYESGQLETEPQDIGDRLKLLRIPIESRARLKDSSARSRQVFGEMDVRLILQRALNLLIPLCTGQQKTNLLSLCIESKAMREVATCLQAGIDPFYPGDDHDDLAAFGAHMAKESRYHLVGTSPYAKMLNSFMDEDWQQLENLSPEIREPLGRIPVVATGGKNGMVNDGQPIDIVSACFILDLHPVPEGSQEWRNRLTRVLARLSDARNEVHSDAPGLSEFSGVLQKLGDRYTSHQRFDSMRDRCLMFAEVVLAAGEVARPWVASLTITSKDQNDRSSEVRMMLHDLCKIAALDASYPPSAPNGDREMAVRGIRRLVDLGFPVNNQHPNSKMTPLMLSAAAGDLQTMGLLLELGADAEVVDSRKRKARGHANKYGRRDAMALLDAHNSRLAIDAVLNKVVRVHLA